MKIRILVVIAFFLLISGCKTGIEKKIKIIFDTDLGPDYDDVGALAFLHAMADSGKVQILATVMGSSQHWADSIVAKYPHVIQSTSDVPDAVSVYRKILSNQPDKSVTIVTVGFLTNLSNLLKSGPDEQSQLSGIELVSKKVNVLVSMAGRFPQGREFNIFIDSAASKNVYENWPGEVIFSGFEIGWKIRTGLRLVASDISESPVKDVFRISIPMSPEDIDGRMSWDETAVLIGVYGTEGFFDTKRGTIIVNTDGSNSWKDDPEGKHQYVIQKMTVENMTRFIEDRMMHIPFTP